ncbi:putative undecaprenol kinase [Alkaliphilus metalliredigens QYMF]|uniref:Undecaprenyl-diphosphatase n=1 Tax=Alkaliphilus metalliredigens (strain QYMF) TaxID=293826 RepID=UPPP_ALKMQ|nr:undecaprenyl-diphosphatase UppP [Alkaliphilus metalliredigens]A6TW45.1 RecName: Full=Undecaprenyl-diphosphatase; AltName: Full=Bacitracin resistance protein; AltName: Full=Undecaprenyl pyrophosphate phosphatase [Alkaliphilus metalliredigens QYMF]ABR50413.1 putative undecaprenol kinase [Alkaliphilus metalliredigens QYMF]
MTTFKAILLGIVQGLTEFLPVSSSGHLAVTQHLLGVPEDRILFLTILLHVGTLFSVFFVYADDIFMICKEFILMIVDLLTGKGIRVNNQYRKLGLLIIVATIPTGIIGLFFKDLFTSFYNSTLIIGISLLVTGTLLWTAEKVNTGKRDIKDMNWFDAVIVGLFQGLAITPGISRSGSTIVGSLFRGFNKELATKFSFLISIPAILGATVFEVKDVLEVGLGDFTLTMLIAGVLASFLSGVFAIRTLINFIKKEKLYYFSYYTWTVGSIVILFSLL